MDAFTTDAWREFAVAFVGAAAALIGLIFVSVSINLDRILKYAALPDRALEAMLELGAVLVAEAFVLVPSQPSALLGIEIVVVGLGFAWAELRVSAHRYGVVEARFRIQVAATAALGLVPATCFVLGGLSLVAEVGGGLYWTVPAVILATVVAITDAWVLLIEINR